MLSICNEKQRVCALILGNLRDLLQSFMMYLTRVSAGI